MLILHIYTILDQNLRYQKLFFFAAWLIFIFMNLMTCSLVHEEKIQYLEGKLYIVTHFPHRRSAQESSQQDKQRAPQTLKH